VVKGLLASFLVVFPLRCVVFSVQSIGFDASSLPADGMARTRWSVWDFVEPGHRVGKGTGPMQTQQQGQGDPAWVCMFCAVLFPTLSLY
jgi:hypothetical protein